MAVLLIVLGLGLCMLGVWKAARTDGKRQWIEVDGKIISSTLNFEWDYYTPSIIYEYTIGGSTRTGSRVRPYLAKYNWAGPAKRLCKRYRAGERVKVFVEPDDPSSSVLEVKSDTASRLIFVSIGVSLLVAGILLLWIDRGIMLVE